jgi:hypothetical protein
MGLILARLPCRKHAEGGYGSNDPSSVRQVQQN